MTVICKNINENYFKVFCKGSPETIINLCDKNTVPQNFHEILNQYTTKGYRVIGLAAKSLNINFEQSQLLPKNQAEKNLIFLGLIIFENKLKDNTKESIKTFYEADLDMVMCSGDNLRTSISVSQECGLINKDKELLICEIENLDDKIRFKWTKLENEQNNSSIINYPQKNNSEDNFLENTPKSLYELYPPEKIDENLIKIQEQVFPKDIKNPFIQIGEATFPSLKNGKFHIPEIILNELSFPSSFCKDDTFDIAIKGSTFQYLYMLNIAYIKYKIPSLKFVHEIYRLILKQGKIFARMSPKNKALIVKELKKEGFITLMCGDGANDILAFKVADISVSLTSEKFSFSGDFNFDNKNIFCINDLLREGKCSLTTSIQTFKYMMIYPMIQSICDVLVSIYKSDLGDYQYLISDVFLIFPLESFLSMTKPYFKLTYHYPIIDLISFPIILSILIHSLIIFAFQFGGYKILKVSYKWENICDFDKDGLPLPCHDNTIIFLISIFQYTGSAISFFVSKPFRQRIYTNWILMIYLAIIYFYSIWITINCDRWSKDLFIIHDLENSSLDEEDNIIIKGGDKMKYYIIIIAIVNTIISIFFEWVIMSFIKKYYEKRIINNYKKEIEQEKK